MGKRESHGRKPTKTNDQAEKILDATSMEGGEKGSHGRKPTDKTTDNGETTQINTSDDGEGKVTPTAAADEPVAENSARPRQPLKITLKRRLEAEGRWSTGAEADRDRLMRGCRQEGMSKADAQTWAYSELERLYPPLPPSPAEPPSDLPLEPESSGVLGLADLPDDWPGLPPNAPLPIEVQWVQSNRLRVRQGDAVDLSRALSHAPSHAAMAWLETSILFPAKWADIVARVATGTQDEQESVRRERRSIEEVRGLLAEMRESGGSIT